MQEESTYHKTFKAYEAAFKHHTDKNVTEDRRNLGTMSAEVPKESKGPLESGQSAVINCGSCSSAGGG